MGLLRILAVAVILTGCSKLETGERFYTVKAGDHYAKPRSGERTGNRIDFNFYVHDSWYYPADHDVGWSKLIGLSNSLSPHWNSGRMAWRCRKDFTIVMAAYFYLNKHRYVYEFESVNEGWNYGSVYFAGDRYHVTLNDVTLTHDYEYGKVSGNQYLCHPYFGGRLPAPHDVHFQIELL
jgi:hypothetical protein